MSPVEHEVNPWRTISTRVVYQNPWITVREDQVITPGGSPGIYGVIETRVATAVAALTPRNEIYLVGQHRYPTSCYSWELIEGGSEEGEDPLAAAQRELAEEAGLIATEWQELGGEVHLSNCISAEVGRLFVARGLSEVTARPDDTERLTVRCVPLAEAVAMVDSGEIKDAISIIGILRLARLGL